MHHAGAGVNFLFQTAPGQAAPAQLPTLDFTGVGSNSIGTVQVLANSEIRIDGRPQVTTAGIQASGASLLISSYQGSPVAVAGDSSLTNGASLTVRAFSGGEPPLAGFENDGTMTIDASSAYLGNLTGKGVIRVTDGSSVGLAGAAAGETIQLQSGHLDIGNARFPPPFLAPITEFGANSSITVLDAQVSVVHGSALGL